jgi:hypothetical protein
MDASMRDFATLLFASERKNLLDRRALCEIRRRIVIVLRAHRIKRSKRKVPVASTLPKPHAGMPANASRACLTKREVRTTPGPLRNVQGLPLRQQETPH